MKKILLTLARWFHVDLTEIKYVEVEKVVEKVVEKPVALGGVVEGDVTVKGDLLVKGYLNVIGGFACLGVCPDCSTNTTVRKRNAKGQFVKEG
jgi:hypothetical protein